MRISIIAVLAFALPLFAAAPRGTIALGVGASSSSDVIVKIDGKNTTVKLAGVSNGTYAGQAFLQCLVAQRIVRVDRTAGRVTLLDGTSVADHLAEFLQTKTAADPCTLGKAVYVPLAPHVTAAATPAATAAAPTAALPARGHVSFGSSGSAMMKQGISMPVSAAPASVPGRATVPDQRPVYSDQPTIYRPPTVGTVAPPQGSTYTPQSPGTTTIGSSSTVTPKEGTTYTPPSVGTTTIPTTSTNPP